MGNKNPQILERNNMDMMLQKYYEDRMSMCGSQAWKDLMVDVAEMLKATDTLSGITDEKTLHFRRGEVSMMRWMLSIAQVSEDSYKEMQDARDE
jgi:hypothetical protein